MGSLTPPLSEEKKQSIGLRAIDMLNGFDKSVWAACCTFGGRPQINAPGWEITEVVDTVFQAVALPLLRSGQNTSGGA